MSIVYLYSRCSTRCKATDWLRTQEISFEAVGFKPDEESRFFLDRS